MQIIVKENLKQLSKQLAWYEKQFLPKATTRALIIILLALGLAVKSTDTFGLVLWGFQAIMWAVITVIEINEN